MRLMQIRCVQGEFHHSLVVILPENSGEQLSCTGVSTTIFMHILVLPSVSLDRLRCICEDIAMGNDYEWQTSSRGLSLNDSISSYSHALITYEPD